MKTSKRIPATKTPRIPLKIAIVGAGSIGFTRRLLWDIVGVPEMADTEFVFTDISRPNLDSVTALCRRDLAANRVRATVVSDTHRRRALAGADFVVCCIRQGGLEAFRSDIEIPLRYGVDQCVGDTLCAGGLMYAQRTIPALLAICKDIREVAKPGAMLFNYSNPMAMNTWACNAFGGVPTVGLCHGVQGAHWQIAHCIEIWAKREGLLPRDYASPRETALDRWGLPFPTGMHRREVEVTAAGINHQTWFLNARWRGIDFAADAGKTATIAGRQVRVPSLHELFREHPEYARTEKVRIDVLHRFGYYSTESNGHLSEYLPWYRKRTEEIPQWIDLSSWIHGETGGYLRVCTEGRTWFESDFPNWMKAKPPRLGPENRSEGHLSYILESLVTGRPYRGHFNIVNAGHIPDLPDGSIVEIPGYVDRLGLQMPVIGPLPLACAATCNASIRVQEMGMLAAVRGDATLLKQAMLHDPLVGAVCSTEEVWQMTDEMLVAQAKWLPQFRSEVPAARARLEAHTRAGTRVRLRETVGAVRLPTKTVAEMSCDRESARANAAAADKGNQTKPARRARRT